MNMWTRKPWKLRHRLLALTLIAGAAWNIWKISTTGFASTCGVLPFQCAGDVYVEAGPLRWVMIGAELALGSFGVVVFFGRGKPSRWDTTAIEQHCGSLGNTTEGGGVLFSLEPCTLNLVP